MYRYENLKHRAEGTADEAIAWPMRVLAFFLLRFTVTGSVLMPRTVIGLSVDTDLEKLYRDFKALSVLNSPVVLTVLSVRTWKKSFTPISRS